MAPVLNALRGAPVNAVVLIDGPSGAGKSTLADALRLAWPGDRVPTLVRLDDIYPGWGGLDAASALLGDHVLRPRHKRRLAAWQRYDWVREQPAGWTPVPADLPLIVEGCGTLAAAHEPLSDIRVWIGADDALRKERALGRDGDVFREHWDQWQQQWEAYCARESPERSASIRLTAR
ncbi:uridine kinase [Cryobacterium psychrophilum]|nr:uridine kinase [Cryobacterium psychrophilum]